MSKDATAIIRAFPGGWSAAIAFGETGRTFLDITTSNSEDAARKWVVAVAAENGVQEKDIRFLEVS